MKILKVILIAIITAVTFSTAEAQVSIHARVGQRPVYHRRTVVVRRDYRPAYHRYYYHHRWYRRPVYHHYYRH